MKEIKASRKVLQAGKLADESYLLPSKILYLLIVVSVILLLLQVFPLPPVAGFAISGSAISTAGNNSISINEAQLLQDVIPEEGVVLKTTWQGIPGKMVDSGLIDIEKLRQYSHRFGQAVTEEDLKIFEPGYDEPIFMDKQNSILVYNVLWALGFANKNNVLDYELEQYGWDTVTKGLAGSYFSFADLGGNSNRPQKGFNYFDLVTTTTDQQKIVDTIASEAAVPSCGNVLNLPDCSCSFAALALAEMAASQGLSEKEIYEELKSILPYRFPQIYTIHAIYFKLSDNLEWDDVDAKKLMSKEFSSSWGVARTHRALGQIASQLNL